MYLNPTNDKQKKKQLFAALARLHKNSDFLLFYKLVSKCLDQCDINNRTLLDTALARSQGATIALSEVIQIIEDAAETLKKLHES